MTVPTNLAVRPRRNPSTSLAQAVCAELVVDVLGSAYERAEMAAVVVVGMIADGDTAAAVGVVRSKVAVASVVEVVAAEALEGASTSSLVARNIHGLVTRARQDFYHDSLFVGMPVVAACAAMVRGVFHSGEVPLQD